jgi:hypothetical protein
VDAGGDGDGEGAAVVGHGHFELGSSPTTGAVRKQPSIGLSKVTMERAGVLVCAAADRAGLGGSSRSRVASAACCSTT